MYRVRRASWVLGGITAVVVSVESQAVAQSAKNVQFAQNDLAASVASTMQDVPSFARVRVEVSIAADDASERSLLEQTLGELLGRVGLMMDLDSVQDARESSSLLARVTVHYGERNRSAVHVMVFDGVTGRISAERAVSRSAPPAVVREEVAHVVQAAVEPLRLVERDRRLALEAASKPPEAPPLRVAAIERPEPMATAPVDEPTKEPEALRKPATLRAPLGAHVTPLLGVGAFASGAGLAPRLGLGVGLQSAGRFRPSLSLNALYMFPFDTGTNAVTVHTSVTSLRATAEADLWRHSRWSLRFAVGGGVDVLRVEPRSDQLPAERLLAATTRVHPIVTGALAAHVAVSSAVSAFLSFGTDLDWARRSWVFAFDDGSRSAALEPYVFRPFVLAGVRMFWGGAVPSSTSVSMKSTRDQEAPR